MIFSEIFNVLNIGLVVLDKDFKVTYWNRWMELSSGIDKADITGSSIFNYYPDLRTPKFLRSFKSVLKFGNFVFFSQKLHRYLFPFKPVGHLGLEFENMQQSCIMGALRDENNIIQYIFITIQDVTANVAYENRLCEMTITDGLTGIYNRRFLETRLKEEFDKNKRNYKPLSLIMFDIDFFKNVNDAYGHRCGDFVLKSVSAIAFSAMREVDVLARYGGEEFSCLLPNTNINGAMVVAERMRRSVMEHKIDFKDYSVSITISLGVAEADKETSSPGELIEKADKALYKAKRSGRNKTVAVDQQL